MGPGATDDLRLAVTIKLHPLTLQEPPKCPAIVNMVYASLLPSS